MPDPLIPSSRPTRPGCRPFTTADAMTLVAAVAVGYAILPNGWRAGVEQGWNSTYPIHAASLAAFYLSGPFWLTLTVAFGVIRLRAPHPPRRRLVCQPGTVACLAIFATLPVLLGALGLQWATMTPGTFSFFANLWWIQLYIPPAVLGAWLTLRLNGRWRPEPGWIDALGMVLGGGWIAVFVALLALLSFHRD